MLQLHLVTIYPAGHRAVDVASSPDTVTPYFIWTSTTSGALAAATTETTVSAQNSTKSDQDNAILFVSETTVKQIPSDNKEPYIASI